MRSAKHSIGLSLIGLALLLGILCVANFAQAMDYFLSENEILYRDEAIIFTLSTVLSLISVFFGSLALALGIIEDSINKLHQKLLDKL